MPDTRVTLRLKADFLQSAGVDYDTAWCGRRRGVWVGGTLEGSRDRGRGATNQGTLSSLPKFTDNETVLQLGEINDQLGDLSNDPETPPSQSMLRAIQRHRDVYEDNAKELRRTKVRTSRP